MMPPVLLTETRRRMRAEAGAILAMEARLGDEFVDAVHAISRVRVLYITGVGKSGHVGLKIAGTMASEGTPASFLHPTEALHGDLGRVLCNDGLMAISRSGECEETLALVRAFRGIFQHQGASTLPPIIALTGVLDSTLAKLSDVVLDCAADEVDGPAPKASATATMVMGNALSGALRDRRGFTADDFRVTHPGGVLGRGAPVEHHPV